MAIIKLTEGTHYNLVTHSINESLRMRREEELKLPLILIGTYFCAYWKKSPFEIATILNEYESDIGPERLLKSIVHFRFIPEDEKLNTIMQRYSDYIQFLDFSRLNQNKLKSRFTIIHPNLILPKPQVEPYSKVKSKLLDINCLLETMLLQEGETQRMKNSILKYESPKREMGLVRQLEDLTISRNNK